MAIYFVRHGQDEDNAAGILNGRRDTNLTGAGEQKAAAVAESLMDKNIQIIIASPLKRAQQTAEIIGRMLGIHRIITEPHLIERDFGATTGLLVSAMTKFSTQTLSDNRYSYPLDTPGAETFEQAYQRAEQVLADIEQKYPPQANILLVSHGEFGKMLRAAAQNQSWQEGVQSPYIENGEIIQLV